MSRRARTVAVAAAAALALGGAAAVAVTLDDRSSGTPTADLPPATTTVTRQTLATSVTVDGELGFGTPVPVVSKATGTVTWLPKAGAVVRRGGTLLRADDRPVVLLFGILPMYRQLSTGAEGPDVEQLERNLHKLGYDGFTVDDEFTALTAKAVRRWQKKLGLRETGTVDPAWAVVANGAIRVAKLTVRLGAPATGEVFSGTGAASVVTADVDADAADWAREGARVSIALPDGKKIAGKVTFVGTKADPKEGETPTVPVTISLAGRAPGRLREAPVDVTHTGEQRKDVLTVPVAALLALAEGGYGLEVVADGTTRYLPVEVGLFADGRAEVRADGLTEGLTVGMPS
jgi:peptidoglycan hydrolase-like protein with peptidoglycan-binding domain